MSSETPERRRLGFGVSLRDFRDVAGMARRIEDLGFDFVTSGEHVSFNVPIANSFISLSVAAGATTRVRLMNSVAIAPLYPAALLAKLGAALDVVSGGRFSLGVGVGGESPKEFEACNVPHNERGARTNEALHVIKELWTKPSVTFRGRFNTLTDISIEPKPVSSPHPPIWVSGRTEAAMRRTAQYGDGWLPYMFTPDQLHESLVRIHAMRADDRPIDAGVLLFVTVHPDRSVARDMAAVRLTKTYAQDFSSLSGKYASAGTPEDVIERIATYVEAGANNIIMLSMCPFSYIDDNLRLFAAEVIPALKERFDQNTQRTKERSAS